MIRLLIETTSQIIHLCELPVYAQVEFHYIPAVSQLRFSTIEDAAFQSDQDRIKPVVRA
jgi:hypothetical protein